jgi:dienelactone hydrolase
MSRSKSLLLVLLASALATPTRAEDLSVLPSESKMLHEYLLAEAQKHFDARRKTVALLKSPDDVKKRQAELRARFIEALGGFPEKTPLNARVIGKESFEGYSLERVVFESRPNHHVTALLYLPEGKAPFPGVLMPCGHSDNGKASETYQRACILMAKNGLAVLCYDPIGQGERIQLLDRQGKPAIPGSTSEHTMVGIGALLVGTSTATYRIWDGIRSLDYLAGRPEIDPNRLGCTGNSGGGTLTAYLMALDDRLVAAAPSCYITSLERLFATIGPQDAEQNITGQVAFGMEHADYILLRAPRPTLICTGTQDYFDIQGAWTTFREAKKIYSLLGHNERMDMIEFDDKHGFSKPRREAAMRWMRRWLLQKDDAPDEGDFPICKDEQLRCTRTGQVLEDFKGKSAFDLNAEMEAALAKKRRPLATGHDKDELLREVRRLIALPEKIAPAKLLPHRSDDNGFTSKIARPGCTITRLVFETEPGIKVPALSFELPAGKGSDSRALIIYVHDEGKAAEAAQGQAIERLVKQGHPVLAVDLRGFGETAPGKPTTGKPNYFGVEEKEAFLSLHLDRPLLGQRVHDLLSIVGWLKEQQPSQPIQVVGVGVAGPVVLHAAAFDRRIESTQLEKALVSWSSVVRTPISHNQLASVVPGALKVYDLPDLAAVLAPRALALIDLTDPLGQTLNRNNVEIAYSSCSKAYREAKAERALRILTSP